MQVGRDSTSRLQLLHLQPFRRRTLPSFSSTDTTPITTSISGDSDNKLFPAAPPPPTPTRHPITTSTADSGLCGYQRDDEEEEIVTLAAFSLNRKKRVKKLLPSFPAEGKVKDSFAVVKESVDPYEDFKASMMEMILAKQLFEERDFEHLLECFLSLNSRHHYGVVWPLSDDSSRRVPHCISDYLQLTAKLPSVYQKNIDFASGAGTGCGAILGMMLGCFWTEYSVIVLICKGVICSGCFAACCVGARGVYRCKGKFWLSITYKIVVDGEWRHDGHQPFENENYGTMNTVFLARESDYVPGILNPQMHSGSNMDVDNKAFQRLVRVSGGPLHEALPRVSEADLEVSRHHITIFLSTHMVIALDVDLPVKQAFHILHKQGIPMAPLGDFCKGQFVGVLSALDFIMIVRELGSHGSNLMEEELETHTISAWKDVKSYLSKQIDGNGRLFPRQLVHARPDENLKDVALKILQNNVATVSVIHSSSGNASIPQLLHLASLFGILKCICKYFKHSFGTLPMLQLPICAIPLGTWVSGIGETNRRPLAMLRPHYSLGLALSLLVQAQVSSIPIVDDNDSLLNVYSRSDINALAKDKIYTHINLEEMTINQGSVNNRPGIGVGILFYLDFEKPVGFIECVKCLRFSV
ncbi:Sucrose nonfermenting 4-like protein [Camellia lanceoleosa]|uniref:Sucrose nonfermenting 4-like protein n=1 Tax=Camellia lanceoleosa TaxID=1840588 RepID=A0ACC0GTT3_9ERIC|nr:Sucrose nonfermenting 4-like protein [Camellia lanceoleosa]